MCPGAISVCALPARPAPSPSKARNRYSPSSEHYSKPQNPKLQKEPEAQTWTGGKGGNRIPKTLILTPEMNEPQGGYHWGGAGMLARIQFH